MDSTIAPTNQHLDALAHAQDIRLSKAALCRRLRKADRAAGRAEVARILRDPDVASRPWASALQIDRLLLAIHRYGPQTVYPLIEEAGIVSPVKPVCGLTERQRLALAALLD